MASVVEGRDPEHGSQPEDVDDDTEASLGRPGQDEKRNGHRNRRGQPPGVEQAAVVRDVRSDHRATLRPLPKADDLPPFIGKSRCFSHMSGRHIGMRVQVRRHGAIVQDATGGGRDQRPGDATALQYRFRPDR